MIIIKSLTELNYLQAMQQVMRTISLLYTAYSGHTVVRGRRCQDSPRTVIRHQLRNRVHHLSGFVTRGRYFPRTGLNDLHKRKSFNVKLACLLFVSSVPLRPRH